jgi:hypothetical protein
MRRMRYRCLMVLLTTQGALDILGQMNPEIREDMGKITIPESFHVL